MKNYLIKKQPLIYITIFTFILLGAFMVMRSSATNPRYTFSKFPAPIIYDARLISEYAYCDVRINGFSIVNNFRSISGIAKANFSFDEFLQNGANEIAIEVDSWNWMDNDVDHLTDEEKAKFTNPEAFCQLEIEVTTFDKDRNRETQTVALLKANLDKNMKLQINSDSYQYDDPASSNASLSMSPIKRKDYLAKNIHSIKRTLIAKSLPNWLWTKAPKYQDIPNNRELLEEAYLELWSAFNNKDEQKLKSLLAISIEENAMGNWVTNDIDDEIRQRFYEQFGYKEVFDQGFEILPFNTSGYTVETFAQGRMVQLVNSDWTTPVIYERTEGLEKSSANHYFAFINGKFRIVR